MRYEKNFTLEQDSNPWPLRHRCSLGLASELWGQMWATNVYSDWCIYHGQRNRVDLGCYVICYDNPSLQAGCFFHLYSFKSHDTLFALLLMSDGEIFAQPSAYLPLGLFVVFLWTRIQLNPALCDFGTESCESTANIASTFALFKDYFNKKF